MPAINWHSSCFIFWGKKLLQGGLLQVVKRGWVQRPAAVLPGWKSHGVLLLTFSK